MRPLQDNNMYQKSVLHNGLRIVTHNIKDRDSLSLGFWVGVGSRYEEARLKGAAHFLEHILFKGSCHYSCEEIKMSIEGVGGTLNAFTSEEQTCFYAKIPSKHLSQTFDVLSDIIIHPKIAVEDIKKEKTVIVEEIKMYRDLPQYFVLELLDQLLWPGHPLGRSIVGTQETIMNMSGRDLKDFHRTHYMPENIVIAACGNLKHDQIVRLARQKFGRLKKAPQQEFIRVDSNRDRPNANFFRKETEQMHLALGMPGYDEWHKDRYVLNLLCVILGGNMSSRLFVEIREKRGLAYSIGSSYKTLHDTGLFLIRAGVDNHKIVEATELILKELDKIRRHGVFQGEFKRGREFLLGQFLLSLEDTMENMLWVGEGVIAKNEIKTLENVIKIFEAIKREDIQRVAKEVFNPKRVSFALVGPVTHQQEKKLGSLLGI
ncbi:MAG: insulinase family protein [Candidatus Omnitrophica bacterium]|nr:insulinase family protein [Candidatus Omnitrophota bacterium]